MANNRQKLNMYTPSPPELMSLQDGDGGLEDTIQTILKELNYRSGTQEQINLLNLSLEAVVGQLKTEENKQAEKTNKSNGSNGSNAKQELDKKIDELKLIKDSM